MRNDIVLKNYVTLHCRPTAEGAVSHKCRPTAEGAVSHIVLLRFSIARKFYPINYFELLQ